MTWRTKALGKHIELKSRKTKINRFSPFNQRTIPIWQLAWYDLQDLKQKFSTCSILNLAGLNLALNVEIHGKLQMFMDSTTSLPSNIQEFHLQMVFFLKIWTYSRLKLELRKGGFHVIFGWLRQRCFYFENELVEYWVECSSYPTLPYKVHICHFWNFTGSPEVQIDARD